MSRWEKVGLAGVILIALPPGPVLGLIAIIGAAVAWRRTTPDTPRVHRQSLIVAMVTGGLSVGLWVLLGAMALGMSIGPM